MLSIARSRLLPNEVQCLIQLLARLKLTEDASSLFLICTLELAILRRFSSCKTGAQEFYAYPVTLVAITGAAKLIGKILTKHCFIHRLASPDLRDIDARVIVDDAHKKG